MIVKYALKNKKVTIIGAGKQGTKKAEKFEEEGAIVTIYDHYQKAKILDADIVFAATSDRQVNHQIVLDAINLQKECASVHYDEASTIHFTLEYEMDEMDFSIYGPGNSIYELRKFQKEVEKLYESSFKEKFSIIKTIREKMIEDNIETRKEILEKLSNYSKESVEKILQAYIDKEAVVYCFHGNRKGSPLENFHELYVYEQNNPNIPTIEDIKRIFQALKVKTTYYIVTLQKGIAYKRIVHLLEGETYQDCLLNEGLIHSMFDSRENILFIIHGQVDYPSLNEGNWKIMELEGEIPAIKEPCRIIPLFLIRGKHLKKDILEKLYPAIHQKYPQTTIDSRCLLEYEQIQNYIKKSVE
ncbi:MAG: hypothetical protein KBT48_04130 [Firmicutes bacterium]|nr:hypothetical protein [Bacillota bacterium]